VVDTGPASAEMSLGVSENEYNCIGQLTYASLNVNNVNCISCAYN